MFPNNNCCYSSSSLFLSKISYRKTSFKATCLPNHHSLYMFTTFHYHTTPQILRLSLSLSLAHPDLTQKSPIHHIPTFTLISSLYSHGLERELGAIEQRIAIVEELGHCGAQPVVRLHALEDVRFPVVAAVGEDGQLLYGH